MKVIPGFAGGLVLAILGMLLIGIAIASSSSKGGPEAMAFLIFWIVGFVLALSASTAGKAWRRLLISSAVLSFLLPISGLIFTGSHIASQTDTSGAATAGAAIGGTLLSGALGFLGFFLSIVFLVIGLLVGRDKQVVYVQALPVANTKI